MEPCWRFSFAAESIKKSSSKKHGRKMPGMAERGIHKIIEEYQNEIGNYWYFGRYSSNISYRNTCCNDENTAEIRAKEGKKKCQNG